MMRVTMHVLGVSSIYVLAVLGVGAIAQHLGGGDAADIARTTSALLLFPFWFLGLCLDRRSP